MGYAMPRVVGFHSDLGHTGDIRPVKATQIELALTRILPAAYAQMASM